MDLEVVVVETCMFGIWFEKVIMETLYETDELRTVTLAVMTPITDFKIYLQ
jgi:hypothetical protein